MTVHLVIYILFSFVAVRTLCSKAIVEIQELPTLQLSGYSVTMKLVKS